ncbi:FAD-dependent oxidoreductase [Nocardioides sp. Kera G14]|uniref:FAD-dependent oxidoreductase n=1 Tax=Nocardioides sp. Kera G14 TaxID=2884264 RepID=UPI001D0F7E93|nr:FAD-binding protein [Nocardioides sp. Kera G14]UDY23049.1 FAD-binding protein [Nocardioides sp. Kera G14]
MTEHDALLTSDVLVIGGGPAGTWAAIKAAQAGASVVLVDKGYTGSSGATASAGTGIWYVDDAPELREEAMASRLAPGGYLAERAWMLRVLDETKARMDELAEVQRYPFPVDAAGRSMRGGLQGPEYMRRQRLRVQRLGVKILDHTPALELLREADGTVSGAHALDRRTGDVVRVEAGAVVLAAGACAFQSKSLGTDVDTGDGALLAVEAGAVLSGMEFSAPYAIAPKNTSLTKTAYYSWANFYRADGTLIEGAGSTKGRSVIARTLLSEPVFARIDQATPEVQAQMRLGQPNFFVYFDRLGINPFTDLFEITLLLEATVRGTGGVRLAGFDCSTDVPGLYAAGDTATRELICGGFTGGGSHNAAWAASSGSWAGEAAARFAQARHGVSGPLVGTGTAGLRPTASPSSLDYREVVTQVQRLVLPYDLNYLRHPDKLVPALATLDATWEEARAGLTGTGESIFRSREAAAMVAHARWMYTAALARTETRGMHRRLDRPDLDPAQQHRLLVGGLDDLWVRPETAVFSLDGAAA